MHIDYLIELDQQVLSFFNGSDNPLLDGLVITLTSGLTWIALYVALLLVVIKNNQTMSQIMLVIGSALLCVVIADGLADFVAKPLVARWRPTNDPVIKYTIDTVNNLREGNHGFFSAHAANTMSLAVFFSLLMKSRRVTIALLGWSLLNGWTRLYLGVHYPGDVVVGIVWGVLTGIVVYSVYSRIYRKFSTGNRYVSTYYTKSGYERSDMNLILNILFLTLAYAFIRGIFMVN